MKYAIMTGNIVSNIAVADAPLDANWQPVMNAQIGWEWNGANYNRVPPPIDEGKTAKYAEIWEVAARRISEVLDNESASMNTVEGKTKRLSDKSNKRLIKKSNGQNLTPAEEADEQWYDAYLDWADSTNDTADQGEDAVEAMTLNEDVDAYSAEIDPVWPTFVAP